MDFYLTTSASTFPRIKITWTLVGNGIFYSISRDHKRSIKRSEFNKVLYNSSLNNSSLSLFFEEFPRFLENLAIASGSLLLAGDFNFHVDNVGDSSASRFINLLEAFNLKQHITQPTHKSGHTLDLIITRDEDDVARNFTVFDPVISDHLAVCCTLSIPKVTFERKQVLFRRLKSIDMEQLREDIKNSPLVDSDDMSSDLDDLTRQYNTVLFELLDKHAPLKNRIITLRPAAP